MRHSIIKTFKNIFFTLAGGILKWLPHPRLRAFTLRLLGASIGHNVRVHNCFFMNHEDGFENLTLENGVYVGSCCLIDLAGTVYIGQRTTISANTTLMSHHDPGESQGNVLAKIYPPSKNGCHIGNDCWIGVGSLVLEGAYINQRCIIAAGSTVKGFLMENKLYAGSPAVFKKELPP